MHLLYFFLLLQKKSSDPFSFPLKIFCDFKVNIGDWTFQITQIKHEREMMTIIVYLVWKGGMSLVQSRAKEVGW